MQIIDQLENAMTQERQAEDVSQSTAKTDQAKVQEAREKGSDINN
jgi:hypothetical protein